MCSRYDNIPTRWIALSLTPERNDLGERTGTGKDICMAKCWQRLYFACSHERFQVRMSIRLNARLPNNLRPTVRPLSQ